MQLFLGLLLIIAAGAATVLGLRQRLWWRVLRRTEVTTPDTLVSASRDGRLDRGVRAVVGTAAGVEIKSTVNSEPCVWHRHAVRHRQTRTRTDRQGRTRRSSRSRRVADVRSSEVFQLAGTEESIAVLPADMLVHRPERRGSRVLPGIASKPMPPSAELFSGAAVLNQYHHREWIIRFGTPLYILGEVSGKGPRVAVRRPTKGLHLISTRSAAHLVRRAQVLMLTGFALAVLSLAAGIFLLIY